MRSIGAAASRALRCLAAVRQEAVALLLQVQCHANHPFAEDAVAVAV